MLEDRITPGSDIIDSRDIIERIEELTDIADRRDGLLSDIKEWKALAPEDRPDSYAGDLAAMERDLQRAERDFDGDEWSNLRTLQQDAEPYAADWQYGEQLIHEDYFTDYIKELVDDCYQMPKGFDSGDWPWRHMAMDWQAAADEAKQDYTEVDYGGHTYFIR